MEIKNLLELIKNWRTIRQFKADPSPDKYIHSILEATRWSPSSPLMETQLKKMLNIPSSLKIYDMVAIGYPVAVPKPKYL